MQVSPLQQKVVIESNEESVAIELGPDAPSAGLNLAFWVQSFGPGGRETRLRVARREMQLDVETAWTTVPMTSDPAFDVTVYPWNADIQDGVTGQRQMLGNALEWFNGGSIFAFGPAYTYSVDLDTGNIGDAFTPQFTAPGLYRMWVTLSLTIGDAGSVVQKLFTFDLTESPEWG